ncbi:MAG: 3-isopropylmalate dehydrogenase [Omnitrophica bacterium GWA2_52_8]|nr:MAG: 3-isopropylmalate dehydrogenase [Omnitrophica bacterium GWA2_52_8]
MYRITVFPGDGIGPEVTDQVIKLIRKIGQAHHLVFEIQQSLLGGASIDKHGVPMTPEALRLALESDAVFLGAVGGPKWDRVEPAKRPEKALLELRKSLEVFANIRPVLLMPELVSRSPLKAEIVEGCDFVILRELTGGIYFGTPRGTEGSGPSERAFNTMVYTAAEVERIVRKAFELARRRRRHVTSVDKANVLEVSRLWRKTATAVHAEFPDVTLDHRYIDDCAMQVIKNPGQFDVIVTGNLFGDILSDECAMLTGSIGMLPSASVGGKYALYEPVHGSAPDIAGKNMANPLASILSIAMMMETSFELHEIAREIEQAVRDVLRAGHRTADIAEPGQRCVSCSEIGDLVCGRIGK